MALHSLRKMLDFLAASAEHAQAIVYHQKLTDDTPRLEGLIRDCLAANDHDRIAKVVHQLCHDYAYAVHLPHARNGGLIGLAAAAIALGAVSLGYDIHNAKTLV